MKEYILYPICKFLDLFVFNSGIPVLAYHSISDHNSCLAVTPKKFIKQVKYLKRRNYQAISPEELGDARNIKKRSILVTFDDGFEDNFKNAFPILQKYGYVATVFIATEFIGGKSEFVSDKNNQNIKMLNIKEIKNLEGGRWSICSHFYSHSNLSGLNKNEIEDEYLKSKKILKKIINKKENSRIIAYPRNKKNIVVMGVLKNVGVKMGFSGSSGFYTKKTNIIDIPRIEIDKNVSYMKFKLFLSPSFQRLKKMFYEKKFNF